MVGVENTAIQPCFFPMIEQKDCVATAHVNQVGFFKLAVELFVVHAGVDREGNVGFEPELAGVGFVKGVVVGHKVVAGGADKEGAGAPLAHAAFDKVCDGGIERKRFF